MKKLGLAYLASIAMFAAAAQSSHNFDTTGNVKTATKHWYESFSIRGYVQVRYNRLLETNPKLKCEQCDRSIGEGGGFIIRRGRIILSGNISNNVFFYIQPDFGSATGTTQNIFQIRDAYFDIGFDKKMNSGCV